ncbi:hypothetical protein C5C18_14135 [Rathayibacter tritici]|nr:hypothetical protein C5C06_14960 [Rathayibacter tritici]PPF62953.1 hypothetical protein C5C21_13635 [Rathayibacter tritici]PPG04065.1 hypothetical protein C5C18_14135 [Rathayibacter tritici]PPI19376.1 hypothetical protein C5D07_01955 [Rathayibacter tritici]
MLAAITLATNAVTPETRGRDLTLLEDASRDTAEQVLTRPTPIVSRREFARAAVISSAACAPPSRGTPV